MGLLDLQTNLKNYKFGEPPAGDRPGGGNSGQPYIKTPIEDNIVPQSDDFLLRGGLNAPLDAGVDVARLTKFFGDLNSPKGVLFVAKQNTLSRIGVRTQASPTALNEGAYTPLSTLAQAGIGFTGAHVYKQGLIPIKGVTTYLDVVNEIVGDESGEGNRLVDLFNTQIPNRSNNFSAPKDAVNVLSYSGGPNSALGVGKTNIKFATSNLNSPLLSTPDYVNYLNTQAPGKENNLQDFREPLLEGKTISTISSFAPSYNPSNPGGVKTYEGKKGSRVGLTSPGLKGNKISYTKGKFVNGENKASVVDKINASKIYTGKVKSDENNDLVKFRIAALDRDGNKTYMHFRAFINSLQDNIGSTWDTISYMGRGEDLYKYSKFTREISVGFTVAAQSKRELIPQYKKLNYLASTLAPDYGTSGYMGGVITTLTLGGWFYEQPGFITSLNLSPPEESPWEIGIDENGDVDPSVKELPHIINVEMSFTPIHKFRPQLQKDENGPSRFIALEDDTFNSYTDEFKEIYEVEADPGNE